MFKKCFVINGKKAIVDAENNKKKEFVYYAGLEEKLSQENLVDEINNKINEYLTSKDLKRNRNSCIGNIMLVVFLYVATIWGFMNFNFIFGSLYFILTTSIFIGNIYDLIKTNKQIKINQKIIVPYLEDRLVEAKEKLEELNLKEEQLIENNKVEEIAIKNIPDNEETKKINFDIEMINDIENKRKKYLLYFELGLLIKKLKSKGYSEEEIEQIEKEISNEATHKEENNSYRLKMSIRRNIYNCLKK